MKPTISTRAMTLFASLVVMALVLVAGSGIAAAGSYVVAECSPGLNPAAPDAAYTASSSHYGPHVDCAPGSPGLWISHGLSGGDTGTVHGAFGAWVFTAPAGTYIIGGSVFSRLATESGQHGYVAVSPDSGAGTAFSVQNDNQGHETGIPAVNGRYLVLRLECTQPNEGNRCVGPATGAIAAMKQVRIALTDVAAPTLEDGGSLFSGAELRGPQAVQVSASDQGAGLASIQVVVNGKIASGDDLGPACNPLPGALTSRMAPCPPSLTKTYTLDTAQAPFHEGLNTVSVCAYDYAQTGTPNGVCHPHEVLVNNLCPGSPVAGATTISAGFAGNKRKERTLAFHRKALVRGRLTDSAGQPIAGAQVCIQAHNDLPGRAFHLVATTTTNQNGGWSYKTNRGPSRIFRIGYRYGAFETSTDLALRIRSRSTLHVSTHRTPFGKKVFFSGELPGPQCAGRTAYVSGTVPGADRHFLVGQATTDPLCHFRVGYSFLPVEVVARFVFKVRVPEQAGYPYRPGRSVNRYIRVLPHPAPKKSHKYRKHRHHHKQRQRYVAGQPMCKGGSGSCSAKSLPRARRWSSLSSPSSPPSAARRSPSSSAAIRSTPGSWGTSSSASARSWIETPRRSTARSRQPSATPTARRENR
jgi:hypothetical protein